ncbi:hypothetical protein F2S72_09265 [Pseudomonas syringae pv. actinidiae]|nr:hypothetical protein [Pseudomonas syringae pv. actinidiae]
MDSLLTLLATFTAIAGAIMLWIWLRGLSQRKFQKDLDEKWRNDPLNIR